MKELNDKFVIRTQGLCKTFSIGGVQQHVLNNLDIDIVEGDFTVIMGNSGSGKSTLLYALSGMDRPTLGKIIFDGQTISDFSNDKLAKFRRTNCGFIFQEVFLNDNMSIMDNVLAAGYLSGRNRKQVYQEACERLSQVGIGEDMFNKFPSQMSGGELQRVGLVRAIINSPKVVFADEPTGALNSANSVAVLDIMNKLHAEGKSILMVTHDMRSAIRGNRILYLKDGVILNEIDLGNYDVSQEKQRLDTLKVFLDEMGW
ncbi:MAG: ABC transporter ATP-binding protein [Clostridia bacterium]|nr:ABC transporter ATP-binding protein [Clostridia bacterium]MDE6372493.1 ABC transporter ATP-binding protein [Clostridia bacterium]